MKQNFFEKPATLPRGWKNIIMTYEFKNTSSRISGVRSLAEAISINNQTTYNDYEKHVLLFVRKDSDFLFTKQAFNGF